MDGLTQALLALISALVTAGVWHARQNMIRGDDHQKTVVRLLERALSRLEDWGSSFQTEVRDAHHAAAKKEIARAETQRAILEILERLEQRGERMEQKIDKLNDHLEG